jgi:hypothetical protein
MAPAGIDIIIPVYNSATTLEASLQSIAEQSDSDFRVIAVDDGSTDGTAGILAGWAARDRRFEVITKANGGIVDALNLALAAVTAPLVARMDGDDLCDPSRLAVQRAYLEAHSDCVALGCQVRHIDEHGALIEGLPQPGSPELADAEWVPAREPYIIHPFLMARSDALKAIGGYRNVPNSEDSDLFWRLAEHGRLYNLPDVLGRYRMHLTSISGSSVLNGRVMSVGSQLGALSARRRHAGKADLVFEPGLITGLKQAATLEGMCALVADRLATEELAHFKLSVAIKLLELTAYRPYELEIGDCQFVRSSLHATASIGAENRRHVTWHIVEAGRRLLLARRLREFVSLVPLRLYPRTIGKILVPARRRRKS